MYYLYYYCSVHAYFPDEPTALPPRHLKFTFMWSWQVTLWAHHVNMHIHHSNTVINTLRLTETHMLNCSRQEWSKAPRPGRVNHPLADVLVPLYIEKLLKFKLAHRSTRMCGVQLYIQYCPWYCHRTVLYGHAYMYGCSMAYSSTKPPRTHIHGTRVQLYSRCRVRPY